MKAGRLDPLSGWLVSGRVGKTRLCQSLSDAEYFDCELPRFRRLIVDPQCFLDDLRGKRLVLDEIHRLLNPWEFFSAEGYRYWSIQYTSETLALQIACCQNLWVATKISTRLFILSKHRERC